MFLQSTIKVVLFKDTGRSNHTILILGFFLHIKDTLKAINEILHRGKWCNIPITLIVWSNFIDEPQYFLFFGTFDPKVRLQNILQADVRMILAKYRFFPPWNHKIHILLNKSVHPPYLLNSSYMLKISTNKLAKHYTIFAFHLSCLCLEIDEFFEWI